MLLTSFSGQFNLARAFGKPLSLRVCGDVMAVRTADPRNIMGTVHIILAQRHFTGMTQLVRALVQRMVNRYAAVKDKTFPVPERVVLGNIFQIF